MGPHPHHPPEPDASGSPRLNLLMACGESWDVSALEQLPRVLRPLGVQSIMTGSGEEAEDAIRRNVVHIAVVDLSIPLHRSMKGAAAPAGPRILQLLRRMEEPPPTVVVRPRQAVWRESARSLAAALREGAFAVLDQPVNLESMLDALRRILRRHYSDGWPA